MTFYLRGTSQSMYMVENMYKMKGYLFSRISLVNKSVNNNSPLSVVMRKNFKYVFMGLQGEGEEA